MRAVILAGGDQQDFSPQGKAFVRIHGKTMVDYVRDAIQQSPHVEDVTVIDEPGSMIENVSKALHLTNDPRDYLLLATCDIPFLTSEAVDDFLRKCQSGADLYYPIVEKRLHERRFPGIQRTYVKLKEGTFTGGNLAVLRPSAMIPVLNRVERILELRKNPLALSAELGFRFVMLMLFSKLAGTLTIPKLEQRIAELFQMKAEAVISAFPEIANDIDKPDDLEWANKLLLG